MQKRQLCVGATLGVLLWTMPASALAQTSELEDYEITKLAEALGDALDSFEGNTASPKARADLSGVLVSIGKRRNVAKGAEICEALSLSEDLGRALRLTNKLEVLAKGRVQRFRVPDSEVSYAVRAPSDYDPRKYSYPVCVIIPGLDDGKVMEAETLLQDYWADGHMRDEIILVAIDMPDETESWKEHSNSDGKIGGLATVMSAVAEVRRTFACDFDRFFLAGRGIGVPVATHLGNMFPHLFAGVIGRDGDAGEIACDNFRNLPTYFAGAGAQATAFEVQTKNSGYDNCTMATIASDTEILTWMKAHPRQSNPTHVTLVPGTPIPNAAYWIRIPPMDAGVSARIEARADRENNTVTITSSGVPSVTVLFNDQLVDMNKPVKVVVNGVSEENLIPRDLDTVLKFMFRAISDPGRVYTAVKTYSMS